MLTFQISGSWAETTNMIGVVQRINRTLDALRTIPGVQAASTAGSMPGVSSKYQNEYKIDGNLDPSNKILADSRLVSAGYFQTMLIPTLMGELCKQASTTAMSSSIAALPAVTSTAIRRLATPLGTR